MDKELDPQERKELALIVDELCDVVLNRQDDFDPEVHVEQARRIVSSLDSLLEQSSKTSFIKPSRDDYGVLTIRRTGRDEMRIGNYVAFRLKNTIFFEHHFGRNDAILYGREPIYACINYDDDRNPTDIYQVIDNSNIIDLSALKYHISNKKVKFLWPEEAEYEDFDYPLWKKTVLPLAIGYTVGSAGAAFAYYAFDLEGNLSLISGIGGALFGTFNLVLIDTILGLQGKNWSQYVIREKMPLKKSPLYFLGFYLGTLTTSAMMK